MVFWFFPKRSYFSIRNAAVRHLGWVLISPVMKCSCDILARECLGSGRLLHPQIKYQGTDNLHRGCFYSWSAEPSFMGEQNTGLPLVFSCFFASLSLDVGCSLGRMTAGFFFLSCLHFIVVPWIATRYLGKLHNPMKPLVSSFIYPEFQRIRGTF